MLAEIACYSVIFKMYWPVAVHKTECTFIFNKFAVKMIWLNE